MPMASRVEPGISLGVNPRARILSSIAATSARDAPAFMTISIVGRSVHAGEGQPVLPRAFTGRGLALLLAGLLGQLFVGDLLERLERIGARDLASVDEHRRRAVHAYRL